MAPERRLEFVGNDRRKILTEHLFFTAQGDGLLDEAAVFQAALGDQAQLFGGERLGQEIERALFHRFDRRTHGCVAGDHDDRHEGMLAADFSQHLEAGETGHFQIEEDQVGLEFLDELQALRAVAGGRHLALRAGQHLRAGIQHDFLVVNDQYFAARLHGEQVLVRLLQAGGR